MQIDATDPKNLSKKILSEKETRIRLMIHAKRLGCTKELQQIFDKYDRLLRNCTDEKERKDMGKLGAVEIYKILGGGGELYVDGSLVVKDD